MPRRTHLVAAVALALAPALAQAQLRDDPFMFYIGGFLQSSDADIRVDGSIRGSDINLGTLGLDGDENSYIAGLEWRFADRHRLALSNFSIKRDATRTLDRTITIGDNTYPVGVSLSSNFKTNVIPITYLWSFAKDANSELALSLGIHWSKIELGVNGATSLGGSVNRNYSAKIDAPLPLVGLRYDHAFSREWQMTAVGQYFYFKAGDAKGSFSNFMIATDYAFTKNFSVGASYTHFTMDVDADSSNWKGTLEYTYSGPAIYVVGRF